MHLNEGTLFRLREQRKMRITVSKVLKLEENSEAMRNSNIEGCIQVNVRPQSGCGCGCCCCC
jgi:hypothetical protein